MKPGTKGIIVYKGKILLILRDNKPDIPYPNTWDCPGGGKENNESFEETGLREMEEEMGIRLKNYYFLGLEEFSDRSVGRFMAILNDDEFGRLKLGDEGQKYGFFTLDEVINLAMPDTIKKFIIANLDTLKQIVETGEGVDKNKFIFAGKNIIK